MIHLIFSGNISSMVRKKCRGTSLLLTHILRIPNQIKDGLIVPEVIAAA